MGGYGDGSGYGSTDYTNEWVDRLAPKATAVIACGTSPTYGGIHAMEGNPTGAMGFCDYSVGDWSSGRAADRECPGLPVQPDNMRRRRSISSIRSLALRRSSSTISCDRPGCSEKPFMKVGSSRLL